MMMSPDWRERPTVDTLLAYPNLRVIWRARRRWAVVSSLVSPLLFEDAPSLDLIKFCSPQKRLRRTSLHLTWQKWSLLKTWFVRLFLVVTTLFKLQHEKRPEAIIDTADHDEQTTPKCSQSHLLARLDGINLNLSIHSALDDSSDSALGVAPHLPDHHPQMATKGSPRTEFPGELIGVANTESTMYSSTPIIHSGLNLRRSRLQTPNSPM